MSTTTTGPLSTEDVMVLRPYAQGVDQASIATSTGIAVDRVNEIIADRTGMNRQYAAELVRKHLHDAGRVAPAAPAPNLSAILTAAEGHPQARIRTTAVKVRAQLELLRVRLEDAERARLAHEADTRAREEAKLRVKRLETDLARARAALKPLKAARAKKVARATEARQARAWAAKNNVECSAHGRVPDAVMAAYRAAVG